MKTAVVKGEITAVAAPLLCVGLFEGVAKPSGATGVVDAALGGQISDLIADGEVTGKFNTVTLLHTSGRIAAKRVAIIGMGKQSDLSVDRVRQAAGTVASHATQLKITRLATVAIGAGAGGIAPSESAQAIVEGMLLGSYEYRSLKTETAELPPQLEEVTVVESDEARLGALGEGLRWGEVAAQASILARDLSNGPANLVTPQYLAEQARGLADRYGLRCEILGPRELRDQGFNTLMAVAEGSAQEPRLIILRYDGRAEGKTLAVVGKGITFDSGGISIKPADNMWEMKHDMSGAAAAIGLVQAAAELKLALNLLVVIPATENMPGGRATRPGDVVTSYGGKTIEIQNTDAEGRLVLADALSYAVRQKPDAIVDLATLTGACVVALGHHASGAFTNNEAFLRELREVATDTGERIWPLPLWEEYSEELKSDVADLKNIGAGRQGGAIIGASFLAKFVDSVPWVHLDIAGTAWTDKAAPYCAKGATGVGVRLLLALARRWQQA